MTDEADLRHDIERYIAIAAEQADRIVELEQALGWLLFDKKLRHPKSNRDIAMIAIGNKLLGIADEGGING